MNPLPSKDTFYGAFRKKCPQGLFRLDAKDISTSYDSYDLYQMSEILWHQARGGSAQAKTQLDGILKRLGLFLMLD